MKLLPLTLPDIARILLGLFFTLCGLNFWLQLFPEIQPAEESHAASLKLALYSSGSLTLVSVIEILFGILLLSGRFTNLALAVLHVLSVNMVFYHLVVLHDGYEIATALILLTMVTLSGRKDFFKTLFQP